MLRARADLHFLALAETGAGMNVTIRVSPHFHQDMRSDALKAAYAEIERKRALPVERREELDHAIAVGGWRERVRTFRNAFRRQAG